VLLQANFCRVEEALRVLEEYGKLYHSKMGGAFKQMRYRVYTWKPVARIAPPGAVAITPISLLVPQNAVCGCEAAFKVD